MNFKNQSARLYQKEKLFDMLYKNAFNEEPISLNENIHLIDNDFKVDIQMPNKVSLIDVTNSLYVDDNLDRILYYKSYKKESLTEFLKLYKADNVNIIKYDSSDI